MYKYVYDKVYETDLKIKKKSTENIQVYSQLKKPNKISDNYTKHQLQKYW